MRVGTQRILDAAVAFAKGVIERILVAACCIILTGCATFRDNSVPKYVMYNGKRLELFRTRPDIILNDEADVANSVIGALNVIKQQVTNSIAAEKVEKKLASMQTGAYGIAERIVTQLQPYVRSGGELFFYKLQELERKEYGYLVLNKEQKIVKMVDIVGQAVGP